MALSYHRAQSVNSKQQLLGSGSANAVSLSRIRCRPVLSSHRSSCEASIEFPSRPDVMTFFFAWRHQTKAGSLHSERPWGQDRAFQGEAPTLWKQSICTVYDSFVRSDGLYIVRLASRTEWICNRHANRLSSQIRPGMLQVSIQPPPIKVTDSTASPVILSIT